MNWLLKRLREPSTSAGVAAVAVGLEQFATTGSWIGGVVAALGAFAAVQGEKGDGGA
ncbi:MAG: hypothetical protein RLO01_01815 [Thalassobaculaceae bacterium]